MLFTTTIAYSERDRGLGGTAVSLEVFHQHNISAGPINLRVDQPSSIGRDTEPRVERFVNRDNGRQLTRSEGEELNHRLRGCLGSGKIDALSNHRPSPP